MHFRLRTSRRLLTALAFAGASALAPPALGYHGDDTRIVDDTAYTLPRHTLRLGLFKTQYGLDDSLLVGTYAVPWVVRMPNLHAKWKPIESGAFATALQLGAARLDVSKLKLAEDDPGDAIISLASAEAFVSWRARPRITVSSSLAYTEVKLDGRVNTDAFEGALTGAVDNLQLTTTFEVRATRVTAFTLHSRFLIFQRTFVDGNALLRPDAFTTIEVEGEANTDALDFAGAWSSVLSAVFSWKHLNLRVGAGYGNWSVAPVGFVLPRRVPIVDLDVWLLL